MARGYGCDFSTAVPIAICDGCRDVTALKSGALPEGWVHVRPPKTRDRVSEACEWDVCPKCHACCLVPKDTDEPGEEHECYHPDLADL